MIVYNITMKVNPDIEAEWLQWQKEEHIPEIMATGLFTAYRIFLLLEQDDTDGNTYIIQYTALSIEHYNIYINSFAPLLRQKAFERWGDQFVAFRTVMQAVN
jgi:hypothetical protein